VSYFTAVSNPNHVASNGWMSVLEMMLQKAAVECFKVLSHHLFTGNEETIKNFKSDAV
jgi:hypothetical protein